MTLQKWQMWSKLSTNMNIFVPWQMLKQSYMYVDELLDKFVINWQKSCKYPKNMQLGKFDRNVVSVKIVRFPQNRLDFWRYLVNVWKYVVICVSYFSKSKRLTYFVGNTWFSQTPHFDWTFLNACFKVFARFLSIYNKFIQ